MTDTLRKAMADPTAAAREAAAREQARQIMKVSGYWPPGKYHVLGANIIMGLLAAEQRGRDAAVPAPGPFIDIVFDGPPSHEGGRFIEVENHEGKSISVGQWVKRVNGYWALRISAAPSPRSQTMSERERLADRIIQDVCDLPDRTSPDDAPDMMLVTGDELHGIVLNACEAILRASAPPADVAGLVERLQTIASLPTRTGSVQVVPGILRNAADALAALAREQDRLREALKWALPHAVSRLEIHRLERLQAGHHDIRSTNAKGEAIIGLWQKETDDIDRARAALGGNDAG